MGKKKSVVFMTLITIVILVLCAVVAFPKVTVPGSGGIKKWNPAAMQYDLGAEFGGGHYAYYYPEGVITEAEHAALEEDDKKSFTQVGNLYLSNEAEDRILTEEGKVSADFQAAFDKSVKIITARFEERAMHTGSDFCVSVVDGYAIRVDLSASENTDELASLGYASQAFTQFASLGELSFVTTSSDSSTGSTTSETVSQLSEGKTVADLIRKVSVKTQYEVAQIRMTFTAAGKEMLKSFKASGAQSLDLTIGGETLLQITSDSINTKNEVELGVQYEAQKLYAQTVCVLINSAMEEGGVYVGEGETAPFVLKAPTSTEIRTYEPVYGDVLIWVYVAILAVVLVACVIAIVKMGGFGVMNLYVTLSYLIICALCFAFITPGVFVVSSGTVLVFLAGLAVVNVLNGYIYKAIKNEVLLGKTVQSANKGGYNKTLWTAVDVYAVVLLGAIALLIGVASLYTVACQAIICILAGAFCTLLWGRVINLMLLSASKDKYKYFRFVREEDDDDE